MINQIQQELPPYPRNLGIYGAKSGEGDSEDEEDTVVRPDKLELPELPPVPADKLRKHPGILKNYKSCPVSPVHEEQEWSMVSTQDAEAGPSNEAGKCQRRQGRHSMYYEDAKTILDMIHSDTEKMIKEITSKYGDLDEMEPTVPERQPAIESSEPKRLEVVNKTLEGLKQTARKERHEHGFLSEDDPNFSSDSLEDCSLDLDVGKTEPSKSKRNTCAKHGAKPVPPPRPAAISLPKRSVSDYFMYDSFQQPVPYRNVSLSDILDDDKMNADNRFLETQRHSSASFFLGQQYPDRKSQESILSDDYGSGGVSFCNSMESILSDDSECKSAPLEVLFGRFKRDRNYSANYEYKLEANCSNSKSYGSSPNAGSGFDYYMQGNYFNRDAPESYAYDEPSRRISESRSPQHKRTGAPGMPTSISYPRFISSSALAAAAEEEEDFIPSLTSKAAQYGGATVKSLSKDFANQRKQMNSNPMYNCNDGNELFVRKTVNATNQITRSDIFGNEASVYVMKKSCSFEIEMGGRRIARNSKKFEQNLQRFEQERQLSDRYQFGGTLEMDYVPHKPPVAHRRSASMKGRGRARSKEKFNTIIGQMSGVGEDGKLRDFVNKDYMPKDTGTAGCSRTRKDPSDEKSFEIYVAEKGVCEDDNMDSLELLSKPADLRKENSVDSLDDDGDDHDVTIHQTELPVKGTGSGALEKLIDYNLLSSAEYTRFLDIEKKIDIINKLVEMEERKLEQERITKENRMRPFECDSRQKGYVKSLTENFDKIAKEAQEELENEKNWHLAVRAKMKRNFSLPDVLEGAKFQSIDFDDDLELAYKQKDEEELSEKDEHSLGEGVAMM